MTGSNNTARFGVSDNEITTIGVPLQDSEGVLHILAERNDFEILKPVVGLVPVFMVDSHLLRDSDESLGHKPMNISGRFLAADAKNNLLIAIGGIDVAMKESGLLALDSDNAADTPQTAYFVQGKVLNGSPFLHTCHLTELDMYTQEVS